MHPTSPHANYHWLIYLPIGIGLLVLTSLIGYGYHTGERLYEVESPLLNVIYEIKLESAATRFWVEEAMDGEKEFDRDLAWGYLEQVLVYLKHLYESRTLSAPGFPAVSSEHLRTPIERLSSALAAWKGLSGRLENPLTAWQSAELRNGLESAFSDFSKALAEIETQVVNDLEIKKKRFRSIQAILIGTCIVLAIGVAVAARHYARERSSNITNLTEMNRRLQEEISRRETMENDLAERERLFRKLYNDSPVSIIIAHLADMRIIDVNDWFVAATGFEKEEIVARSFHDIVICSDPAEREKFQQSIIEQKQLRNLECQLPVKAGSVRTALLSATLIDLNGEAHFLSSARDITEFKAAERILCQSEQKFRSLFESAPDFIHLVDLRGVIQLANPAACRRLGYPADEVTGRPLADFLSPESRERFIEQLPELLKKGALRAEYDMVERAGAIIPVDCSAITVESESDGAYILLFQKDITERRRNERKFEAVYQFLVAANHHQELHPMLDDFLAVIGEATACDAAAVRVENGAPAARPFISARGFDLDSCQLSLRTDSRMCVAILQQGMDTVNSVRTPGGSFYCNAASSWNPAIEAGELACPVHPICGQPPYESFALTPIFDPNGRIGLIHIAYRDKNKVSMETIGLMEAAALQLSTAIQRVRAEEALKCSYNELEERVQERTEQLSSINERLKAEIVERTLTERSLVHHQQQLRKLSSVLIQTEERERHRIATAIHDGVGQTLAAAKIKLGALQPSIPKDIWEGPLGDIRGLISLAIEESRSLTFELSPPVLYEIGLQPALKWMAERFQRKFHLPITVKGDGSDQHLSIPHRVLAFQSVRELCFNAVKHAHASKAEVSFSKDGGCFRIEVSDDGTGFDTRERRRAGEDMGFGLFSIREQFRHYGGTLSIDSRRGIGTRVTLLLPFVDNASIKREDDQHD